MVSAGGLFTGWPAMVDVAGVRVDLAAVRQARRIVLVEGGSDQAALEVLASRRGLALGPGGVCVVAMGGATSIAHFVRLLGPRGLNLPLGGLCDAGQEDYVRGALAAGGLNPAASRAQMEAGGFFVCTADLEDELIRAVGTAAVLRIIAASGELRSFRTFQRQPAHRDEGVGEQLHRFMGTRSGRKTQYARLLAGAVDLARVPRPLDRVLAGTCSWPRRPGAASHRPLNTASARLATLVRYKLISVALLSGRKGMSCGATARWLPSRRG